MVAVGWCFNLRDSPARLRPGFGLNRSRACAPVLYAVVPYYFAWMFVSRMDMVLEFPDGVVVYAHEDSSHSRIIGRSRGTSIFFLHKNKRNKQKLQKMFSKGFDCGAVNFRCRDMCLYYEFWNFYFQLKLKRLEMTGQYTNWMWVLHLYMDSVWRRFRDIET